MKTFQTDKIFFHNVFEPNFGAFSDVGFRKATHINLLFFKEYAQVCYTISIIFPLEKNYDTEHDLNALKYYYLSNIKELFTVI